jgi:hypothetical protein
MGIKYFKQHLFIVKTILSENLIEKIWFKSYTLNQGLFWTNTTSV